MHVEFGKTSSYTYVADEGTEITRSQWKGKGSKMVRKNKLFEPFSKGKTKARVISSRSDAWHPIWSCKHC